ATDRRQILRLGVANRHRGIALEQHERQRLAEDVSPSQYDGALSFDTYAGGFDHLNDALRRAGFKHRMPLNESTEVVRMKSVCVLVGRHRFEYDFAVDMLRKRQLNQYPVDLGIGVFLLDQG